VAVDFTSFTNAFPEYKKTSVPLVDAKLAEARLQVDSEVWGTKTDLGVSYLAAHLLAMSSHGQHARLVPANAKATREDALTTYEREYQRLLRSVASGFRVA
jgi:hypothetical protein